MTEVIKKELELINSCDGRKLSDSEFEFVFESDAVVSFENLGQSGAYADCDWWSADLVDGTSVDLYVERDTEEE